MALRQILTEPNEIIITPTTSVTQFSGFGVSCHNEPDGWINLSVTGGTNDYIYSWTGPNSFSANGYSVSNIPSLAPGNHTFYVFVTRSYL